MHIFISTLAFLLLIVPGVRPFGEYFGRCSPASPGGGFGDGVCRYMAGSKEAAKACKKAKPCSEEGAKCRVGMSARLIIGGGSLNADCELKERPPPVKKERKVLVKKKTLSSVERVEQGMCDGLQAPSEAEDWLSDFEQYMDESFSDRAASPASGLVNPSIRDRPDSSILNLGRAETRDSDDAYSIATQSTDFDHRLSIPRFKQSSRNSFQGPAGKTTGKEAAPGTAQGRSGGGGDAAIGGSGPDGGTGVGIERKRTGSGSTKASGSTIRTSRFKEHL
ncbi:hypothetical protein AAL_05835 [Moelleriella libera RCEF 2490]|uniref:Uncharacterized protein n=1 Tax=Moelleriella libera RCEF 2490 TaxID=1081109 RepID=A0A162IFT3_9HYPO|nr:hypothetical protein AAL_05835 [Moelleriella libera RCEF 2490]